MANEMKRVGWAITAARGSNEQRSEYGLYRIGAGEKVYVRYEGRRYRRADGVVQEGLPLAGPMAAHCQPLMDFNPAHYETVRFF